MGAIEAALEARQPTGQDELFLLETALPPVPAIAGLAARVMAHPDGSGPDWAAIPASGLAAIALRLRRVWLSDLIRTEGACPMDGCGERFDLSFTVSAYLAGRRPRVPRNVAALGDGWYQLAGGDARFRVPSVADLLSALDQPDPVATLWARCVDPPDVRAGEGARIDRSLAALAPTFDGLVGGACPACGAHVSLAFDPITYTLAELRDAFAGLHWETHVIASAYGWSEENIHALPRGRRQRYTAWISEGSRL